MVFKVLKFFNTMVLKLEAKQAAASVVMAQEVKKKEKKCGSRAVRRKRELHVLLQWLATLRICAAGLQRIYIGD